ncbi:MAG: 2,3-bisphosphoglycerate-independent phosphoglycerate mutase [Planctomycetes bacterium]|nr:2,3-bisphosphoglycerate-independent phosphoglycerate mutase [Planctomycetota bacterium]
MDESITRPTVLIVRDGWGHNPHEEWNHANAIHLAETPVNDRLLSAYPHVQIRTSGEDVGLPTGVMGNSEVGHQNIGAGRIVDQEVMRISRAIRAGAFFENSQLQGAIKHVASTGGSLHLLGLLSDGRVHSDLEHAFALVDLCSRMGLKAGRLFVHAIMDGRDTSPNGGIGYLRQLEDVLKKSGIGRVASIVGRYYAMDRDLRWERVKQAYDLLTRGSERIFTSAQGAIQDYYDNPTEPSRQGDEFVLPASISPVGQVEPSQQIQSGDAVVFFNYRGDRTRELTKAFVFPDPQWNDIDGGGFDRGQQIEDLYFATMTGYEQGLPVQVVFEKLPKMPNIFGEIISRRGLSQFRCAETEKYPHVTFFFNDYRDDPFPNEERVMLPSPRDVSTYDKKPEMSAHGITDAVLERIESQQHDVYIINFANGDMVGHTGNLAAAIRAVEVVDECVGKIVAAVLEKGGTLIVTADHGNCEQMIDPSTGEAHTAHTTYDVDLIVVDDRAKGCQLREGGRLADIAPTMLALMGVPQPEEMTGQSLINAGTPLAR